MAPARYPRTIMRPFGAKISGTLRAAIYCDFITRQMVEPLAGCGLAPRKQAPLGRAPVEWGRGGRGRGHAVGEREGFGDPDKHLEDRRVVDTVLVQLLLQEDGHDIRKGHPVRAD